MQHEIGALFKKIVVPLQELEFFCHVYIALPLD
jgi:hypothetical protein